MGSQDSRLTRSARFPTEVAGGVPLPSASSGGNFLWGAVKRIGTVQVSVARNLCDEPGRTVSRACSSGRSLVVTALVRFGERFRPRDQNSICQAARFTKPHKCGYYEPCPHDCPHMTYREVVILIPSHSLEDFPTDLGDGPAASLLNSFSAAWHPGSGLCSMR